MNSPDKIEIYLILHDGTSVKESFYNMILEQIYEVIPGMEPGVSYTAEDLCGEEFWMLLGNGCFLAGKCVSHMVKAGKLPLDLHGCEHKLPRKYIKKAL